MTSLPPEPERTPGNFHAGIRILAEMALEILAERKQAKTAEVGPSNDIVKQVSTPLEKCQ